MRQISQKTKKIKLGDPQTKVCALKGIVSHTCSPKIEWHHNLIFQGRQCDEPETIISICSEIHNKANRTDVKEMLDYIMLERMSDEQISRFSKAVDYFQRYKYLRHKYGPLKI